MFCFYSQKCFCNILLIQVKVMHRYPWEKKYLQGRRVYAKLIVHFVHLGQSYFHATDLPETRFSEKSLRISQSETASYRRYPDVPVGQLATSLFTAGHPLEIRNELKTASNVFIIGSRWVWCRYYCQIECGLWSGGISVFLDGRIVL